MTTQNDIKSVIRSQGLVPLYYHDDPRICIEVMKALAGAGVRCIEFTNRGTRALENFRLMVKERDKQFPGLLLATGTIKSAAEANLFSDAGADLVISPVFTEEVATIAAQKNLLWIPGCMTPTEIHIAQRSGCSLIKLFPGNVLGPGFVEAIQPLFTGLEYMVTGGVEPEASNLQGWFKSGVKAVGMGSKLISKELLQKGDFNVLTATVKDVLQLIQTIRA